MTRRKHRGKISAYQQRRNIGDGSICGNDQRKKYTSPRLRGKKISRKIIGISGMAAAKWQWHESEIKRRRQANKRRSGSSVAAWLSAASAAYQRQHRQAAISASAAYGGEKASWRHESARQWRQHRRALIMAAASAAAKKKSGKSAINISAHVTQITDDGMAWWLERCVTVTTMTTVMAA